MIDMAGEKTSISAADTDLCFSIYLFSQISALVVKKHTLVVCIENVHFAVRTAQQAGSDDLDPLTDTLQSPFIFFAAMLWSLAAKSGESTCHLIR